MSGRGAFNEFAARVCENGFTVTPTKGKKPVVPRWQNPTPTNVQWLGRMLRVNRYVDHNLGIVCGRVVGIDIDADDPVKVGQLEALASEHLGPTSFQRVGVHRERCCSIGQRLARSSSRYRNSAAASTCCRAEGNSSLSEFTRTRIGLISGSLTTPSQPMLTICRR
jgi:hypothetical protein